MNSCEAYQEHLSAYVDGELNDAENNQIKAHLENCAQCSALHELFHEIKSETQNSAESAPPELLTGVMNQVRNMPAPLKIAKPERKPISMRTVLRRYVPLAACLAIVIFAIPHIISTLDGGMDNEVGFRTRQAEPTAPAPATAHPPPAAADAIAPAIAGHAEIDVFAETEEEVVLEFYIGHECGLQEPDTAPTPPPSDVPPSLRDYDDPTVRYQNDAERGAQAVANDWSPDRDFADDSQVDVVDDGEYGIAVGLDIPVEEVDISLLEHYYVIIRAVNIELPLEWLLDEINQIEGAIYSETARISRENAIKLIEQAPENILSITFGNENSNIAMVQIVNW